ncbi:hypothetical protein B484DRAFT_454057 [Ochromonadaceae sp. CCMP2298]|nr:hypothetical protein B484DRAFT_454057 [Ochromonadaceae sp. CCMP2298]
MLLPVLVLALVIPIPVPVPVPLVVPLAVGRRGRASDSLCELARQTSRTTHTHRSHAPIAPRIAPSACTPKAVAHA